MLLSTAKTLNKSRPCFSLAAPSHRNLHFLGAMRKPCPHAPGVPSIPCASSSSRRSHTSPHCANARPRGGSAGAKTRCLQVEDVNMNLPAGFLLPPSTSFSFFKENKHEQNLPFTVPVQHVGHTKGHCCCTNRGSPEWLSTKAACVLPTARMSEGLLLFWEGVWG